MKAKPTIIVGGGPAGLAAGYELTKHNIPCVIYEKNYHLGGIASTIEYKGFHFDTGGHRFFSKNKEINELWQNVMGEDFLDRPRLSRIYYNKKWFNYPLKLFEVIRNLGLKQSCLIFSSYLKAKLFPYKPENSFEEWVSNRFGKRLYEMFFKSYTEKVWGIPCTELSAEWAAQRIKNLNLITAVMNALFGNRGNKIKTLIDRFKYPKLGPGMMWAKTADLISKKGSNIYLGTEIVRINIVNDRVDRITVKDKSGEREQEIGQLISSMPIRELVNKISPRTDQSIVDAANKLRYRDFITVALVIEEANMFPDNWIYVHSPEVKMGRIQNANNWSPYMVMDKTKTCLGLEYFCFENDGMWDMADEKLIELGISELVMLGLLKDKNKVKDGKVIRVPKAYPIYDPGYKENLSIIRNYLEKIKNLQSIGRNGMHRYNNMDHSMLTGIMAARNIMGENHELWSVNADEEYLEASN